MYSLRRTLAVRFALTMFVALLLLALWAYLGVRGQLSRQLDQSLASTAQMQLAALGAGHVPPPLPDTLAFDEFLATVNRFVVVRAPTGRIVSSNSVLADDLPIDTAAVRVARAGEIAWSRERWQGMGMRSIWLSAPPASRVRGMAVLQVSASLAPLEHEIRSLLLRMLATVLLGTAATGIGAGWLASRSVAPVDAITGQARAVRAGRLGQRITAHADVEEFEGLIGVLNGMLERLDRTVAWQRQVIADIGHDLRTPLTVILGNVELALSRERTPEAYRQVLASTLEEAERLTLISEALLMLARLDAGELLPHRAATDLDRLADEAAARARGRTTLHTIRSRPGAAAVAWADSKMLALVLDQLLDNAIRHTPAGTEVEVSVEADGENARVRVDDSGPGLPDEMLAHLFDRFYRADPARSRAGGAGLGLTVVAAIVEAHGGRTTAERSPCGGLRIEVVLPTQHEAV